MGNIRAGTLMKFTKLLIANVSPGFLHTQGKELQMKSQLGMAVSLEC